MFYDTDHISGDYDGSRTYMLLLKDSVLNHGEDKPRKRYYSTL